MNGPALDRLRALQQLLEEAFRVPGTRVRFGWDAIIGLVPGGGDLVGGLMACAMIVQAHRLRVPRLVLFRMLINVAVDLALGAIPVAGDVADVFWKANSRNLALIERYAGGNVRPSRNDRLFVAAVVGAVVLMAAVSFGLVLAGVYWLLQRGWF